MRRQVERALSVMREVVADLAEARLDGADAAVLVEGCAQLERLAAAGRGFAAREVARSAEWKRSGARTPATWLAEVSGTSVKDAIGLLDTVRGLDDCPATAEAFVAGELTPRQAEEVVTAVVADPTAESDLLEVATTAGVRELREAARRVRSTAEREADAVARHERVHRARHHRRWVDGDGAACGSYRTTPEHAAALWAACDRSEAELAEQARRAGVALTREQISADALVSLTVAERSSEAAGVAHALVRVDATALARGATDPGETCEIAGIGPIPVASARALLGDAVLDVVVTRGVEVVAVAHHGRTIPAAVRTAVAWAHPTCDAAGCRVTQRLEHDHIEPFADGGLTAADNLGLLCTWHHHARHHRGWTWQRGPDHRWHLHPPSG